MTIEDASPFSESQRCRHAISKTTQTNLCQVLPHRSKADTDGRHGSIQNLMEKANVGGLGALAARAALLGKDSLDIDAYVTSRLWTDLSKWSPRRAADTAKSVARTTDMLQRYSER
jgi:hypothetical protein